MVKRELIKQCEDYVNNSPGNFVKKEDALSPELVGIRIFDPPILGFASANDELFQRYKEPGIIGPQFITPHEWLPEAKTIVSLFFHFSSEVVESNSKDFEEPSFLWLHGYKEGMDFIKETLRYAAGILTDAEMETVVPMLDKRFRAINGLSEFDDFRSHSSNWSERHAAYAAGLGTFGLSRGLITEKGMAGRFGSIITTGCFEPDNRQYTNITEFCNNCGACALHCPVDAISKENGKEHLPCHNFLEEMKEKYGARGSCGKCQVKAPCTYERPKK